MSEEHRISLQEHIDYVMDYFDFDCVEKVMDFLNWTWASAEEGIPDTPELRSQVRYLMREAYNEDYMRTIGTGGFYVTYYPEPDVFEVNFKIYDVISNEW